MCCATSAIWYLPEIREGRELGDAILFRKSFVVDFHKVDAERVGVVIDFLQFGQYLVAGDAASRICIICVTDRGIMNKMLVVGEGRAPGSNGWRSNLFSFNMIRSASRGSC